MRNDHVQFLQSLIRTDSTNPPGNEHHVTEKFIERCEAAGLDYGITDIDEDRSNFEVSLKSKADTAGRLMLCGHMDTVKVGAQQWDYGPFSGEIINDRLYGRGASDMKSGLAAMYLAMEQLHREGIELSKDVVFLATAGEEVDSCGAFNYLESAGMEDIDALVIGEPTKEKVAVGHKGALWVEIIISGKTAHGAMPEHGINAVEWMAKVIRIVEALKIDWKVEKAPLGKSSISANKITGGVQTNVIPDQCRMNIDIRSVAPQNHQKLFAELNERLEHLFGQDGAPEFEMSEVLNRPSILTVEDEEIIETALYLKEKEKGDVYGVSYYTDAAVLNSDSSIPTLIYGPGDETLAH